MRMVRACIYFYIAEEHAAEPIMRKHAFNGAFERLGRMTGKKFFKRKVFEVADKTGIVVVHLLLLFSAGNRNFVRVDDDDVIARVLVRRIRRLVLASRERSGFCGDAAERFTCSVDHVPCAFYILRFYKNRIHNKILQNKSMRVR